jgi:hypothetical protein
MEYVCITALSYLCPLAVDFDEHDWLARERKRHGIQLRRSSGATCALPVGAP